MKPRFIPPHARRLGWLQRVVENLQQAGRQLQQMLTGGSRTAVLRPIPIRLEPARPVRRPQQRHWRD